MLYSTHISNAGGTLSAHSAIIIAYQCCMQNKVTIIYHAFLKYSTFIDKLQKKKKIKNLNNRLFTFKCIFYSVSSHFLYIIINYYKVDRLIKCIYKRVLTGT